MKLIEMIERLTYEEITILAKYLYSNPYDTYNDEYIMSDDVYEFIKKKADPDSYEYKIPWDEVKLEDVKDILLKVGYPLPLEDEENIKDINLDRIEIWPKPKSIEMVETERDVIAYFEKSSEIHKEKMLLEEYLLMLKLDGWNLQIYYEPGNREPNLITTRGRSGNVVECTEHLKILMPPMDVKEPTLVGAEIVLNSGILTYLRVKYQRPFKNSRNSVSSIIHNTINIEEIKDHIAVFAFDIQFSSKFRFDSRLETLNYLQQTGFHTPPVYMINNYKLEYRNTFSALQRYYLDNMKNNWACDGIVVCPNRYEISNTMINSNKAFQDGFMAVKTGTWSKKMYTGQVIDIKIPPSSGGAYREPLAVINPTDTDDGRSIQNIPLKNINRAKCGNDPVDIGDEIIFSYHSKQVVKFRGKNGVLYFE